MKKIILIVLALVTIQVSAQEQRLEQRKREKKEFRKANKMHRNEMMKDFTPEEKAKLQTKKMTLELDLTESQQKQIEKLALNNAKERQDRMEARQARMKEEKGGKPSKEERYAMMNEKLDKQLEMKQKMKKILNAEQFEKWEKMQDRKQEGSRNKNAIKRMKK